VERGKVEKFISGAKCRRTYLDQEMDGRVDRGRCEEGEERCDVCQKDDAELAEVEELRETYIREQEQRVMQERVGPRTELNELDLEIHYSVHLKI
jgi:hypothetical protein